MAQMSNYLEDQLITHLFRTGSFTKPTVLAIALCTASPSDVSTGATIVEVPNAEAYVRQVLNPLDANWAAIVGNNGTTSNASAISFPTATGVGWGTVTSIAICDSATWGAGNMLFFADLSSPVTVNAGGSFSFSIGDLTVQIDN
jgi:hypothetical protein